jgi:hypothetical protein
MTNSLSTLLEEFKQFKFDFQEKAKASMNEVFKGFFNQNPSISAIIWQQYTPYFNDGDTCEFGVHDFHFFIGPESEIENLSPWGEYQGDREDCYCDYCFDRAWMTEGQKALVESAQINEEAIEEFESVFNDREMEDIFLSTFGDHCYVIATKDGFQVEELNHD